MRGHEWHLAGHGEPVPRDNGGGDFAGVHAGGVLRVAGLDHLRLAAPLAQLRRRRARNRAQQPRVLRHAFAEARGSREPQGVAEDLEALRDPGVPRRPGRQLLHRHGRHGPLGDRGGPAHGADPAGLGLQGGQRLALGRGRDQGLGRQDRSAGHRRSEGLRGAAGVAGRGRLHRPVHADARAPEVRGRLDHGRLVGGRAALRLPGRHAPAGAEGDAQHPERRPGQPDHPAVHAQVRGLPGEPPGHDGRDRDPARRPGPVFPRGAVLRHGRAAGDAHARQPEQEQAEAQDAPHHGARGGLLQDPAGHAEHCRPGRRHGRRAVLPAADLLGDALHAHLAAPLHHVHREQEPEHRGAPRDHGGVALRVPHDPDGGPPGHEAGEAGGGPGAQLLALRPLRQLRQPPGRSQRAVRDAALDLRDPAVDHDRRLLRRLQALLPLQRRDGGDAVPPGGREGAHRLHAEEEPGQAPGRGDRDHLPSPLLRLVFRVPCVAGCHARGDPLRVRVDRSLRVLLVRGLRLRWVPRWCLRCLGHVPGLWHPSEHPEEPLPRHGAERPGHRNPHPHRHGLRPAAGV
mmetsp:Transcript_101919/g.328958  ORF Transcript_101919/g.328958 Transcript_101919/m.328958 type:complete len:571 (+) Transcript_101919:572-2284(+)